MPYDESFLDNPPSEPACLDALGGHGICADTPIFAHIPTSGLRSASSRGFAILAPA